MKKILVLFLLGFWCSTSQDVLAQSTFLEYSMSRLTTLPPYYGGMPTDIVLSYYWFDHAMRVNPTSQVDSFIGTMHLNDTAKYVADAVYRVTEDDPISFYLWLSGRGVTPDPYSPRSNPSHIRMYFENKLTQIFNDTGRTGFLLDADFIAHVHVNDTVSTSETSYGLTTHMVLVNSQIVDMIKGKKVFACADMFSTHGKDGVKPQTVSVPFPTSETTADSGTCMQFEYSLEWDRMPNNDYGVALPLVDTNGQTWIKPNSDYIVFLSIQSYRIDGSGHIIFSVKPVWGVFGRAGGMYPVQSGYVYDPKDDFGFGASSGLTVSDWKTRLRARIYKIKNP